MNLWLRAGSVCLLAGSASLACSGGVYSEAESDGLDGGESVATVQEAVDQVCVDACMRGCVCTPEDGKPAACRRLCLMDCREACPGPVTCTPSCAGKTCGASDGCTGVCSAGSCPTGTSCGGGGTPNQCGCTANCAGKTCGASDGCGGTCNSGTCPGGAVCGGGGVPGLCALPNLNGVVTGTLLASPFLVKQARFDVHIRNTGPAPANNIELLFQTNSPATMSQLITSNGFVCHPLAGFEPRLGLRCFGGNISAFGTANITLQLALSTPGFNVLSMLADSNFAIVELDENDNWANGGVWVP